MRNSPLNILKRSVFLFALLFVMVVTLNATAKETLTSVARKYYYGIGVQQNFNKAFKLYLQAAQKGDIDAMFVVGGLYMQGLGVPVNKSEAFRWLYNAAINGRSSKESQRVLAQFFITGQNAPQNFGEAVHWYEQAANGGDPEAQSELAFIHFTGKHIERDYGKARYWYEIAAKKGYALAQYNMGILWYTGNGVANVDMVKAYAWFNLAAANGHNNGKAARKFLESTLSGDDLLRAQNISTELYREIKKL